MMNDQTARGFSLVELMLAVAILAIVSAFAIPVYNNYIREGRLGAMRQNLSTLRVALEDFRLESAAGNYGAAATYSTTAAVSTQFNWQPDGDAGRYTYGVRTTAGTPPSYDVWAIDPVAQVWLRCDNRMNRCCNGTGAATSACP